MHFWQEINFSIQRTNFIHTTTVRTNFIFGNQAADFSVFHLFKDFSHVTHDGFKVFILSVAFFINGSDFFFDSFCCGFTRFFLFHLHRFLQVSIVGSDNFNLQVSVHLQQFHLSFFFTNCCHDFFLEGNQFTYSFVSFKKGFQHDIF